MLIELTNNQDTFTTPDPDRLEQILLHAVAHSPLGKASRASDTLAFHFLGPEAMAELNEEYLNHEGPTDVITFDYRDGEESPMESERTLGEIFVCPAVAHESAGRFKNTLCEEVVLYLIHGILHLSGFDDKDADAVALMRKAEADAMARVRNKFDLAGLFAVAETNAGLPASDISCDLH